MELRWLLTLLCVLILSDAAKILIFQPTPAKGHVIAIQPFFEELASRGHNVTIFTSFPHKPPLPNLNEIDVSHKFPPLISNFSFEMIKETMPSPFQAPLFMTEIEYNMCESMYSDEILKPFLESNETYDLVVTEIFTTDCFVPFAHKLKAPLISFMTSSSLPWAADRVGLPDNPSYIPNYFVDSSGSMCFSERLYNLVVLFYTKFLFNYYTLPLAQRLVSNYFDDSVPPIHELIKKTSLILVNSHFAIHDSRPFPPNVVEIGGLHLRNSRNSLPQDLKSLLDKSTEGVVVVSFGSMVRVSTIPSHIINMFLQAFAKIPQTVILKYEDALPQAPQNVIVRKWLPQGEIIEHKNVKAVVTHGGLASTIECIYHGKPLVGIPFFADQARNLRAIGRKGAGVLLDLEQLTAAGIETALKAVLNDPSYSENARRLSRQFRDRPMTALQSAVYWTEYVIRHQGAPHLRPASVDLPWYRETLLDVAAVLLLLLAPFVYLVYFLFFRAVEVSPNDFQNYEKKKAE